MIKLSIVVLTKNEEGNIRDCLKSVAGWAEEILIIDDGSTDNTLNIAREYTDRIIQRKMDVEGSHRNFAYSQAKNLWVLSLDADEQVSKELREEIGQVISNDTPYDAFSIPLRNYIGDYWIRYGGWYPAGKVKLFRKDKFKYEEVRVHPRVFIEGKCGHLSRDIIHKGYVDLEQFLSKLNRQTTWEAQKWYTQKKPMRLGRFIWRTIDRFVRTYFVKKGYKDGLIGFTVAFNAGLYQFISYLKYREIIFNKRLKK